MTVEDLGTPHSEGRIEGGDLVLKTVVPDHYRYGQSDQEGTDYRYKLDGLQHKFLEISDSEFNGSRMLSLMPRSIFRTIYVKNLELESLAPHLEGFARVPSMRPTSIPKEISKRICHALSLDSEEENQLYDKIDKDETKWLHTIFTQAAEKRTKAPEVRHVTAPFNRHSYDRPGWLNCKLFTGNIETTKVVFEDRFFNLNAVHNVIDHGAYREIDCGHADKPYDNPLRLRYYTDMSKAVLDTMVARAQGNIPGMRLKHDPVR